MNFPTFECNDETLNKAYRLALACVASNTIYIKTGLLDIPSQCVMAGLDYKNPWTRDASINVMNAIKYLDTDVAKNMLLSVLKEENSKIYIGDQYWDKVIWILGAYDLYNVTLDINFLRLSYEAITNTLSQLEEDEFDKELNLFRGPAVYGDGVAAYPDKYHNENMESAIWKWQDYHKELAYKKGYGLPMISLSTNCLYKKVYNVVGDIAKILGEPSDIWYKKEEEMKKSINKHFYNGKNYDYLYKESNNNEGMGLSFLILFDITDKEQTKKIVDNTYVSKNGIPCVWPTFNRYKSLGYGRHSGTIWPHISGIWARAMRKIGLYDKFEFELFNLANKAVRDMQFVEIYHPDTGLPYGGIQEAEWTKEFTLWKSCDYQTWSATAFIDMIYYGIFGIEIKNGEVSFNPRLPKGIKYAKLSGLIINNKTYDLEV